MPSWLQILIFTVVEVACLLLGLYYGRKFYKNKEYYPIKQLSPLITILLGSSFYVCQLTLFTLMIFFYDTKIKIEQGDGKIVCIIEDSPDNSFTYEFISFIYILSRGFCYAFTVAKSYRVLVAFQRNQIAPNSWQLLIFKEELYLIIFAILYGVLGFPIVVISTTSSYGFEKECWLTVYETNFGGVKYNSWIEEIIMLLVVFLINPIRINDRLVNLTINLQVLYVFWFAVNSLLSKYIPFAIEISCWVRTIVMFYGYIYVPYTLKEANPTLYIIPQHMFNFDKIIERKFRAFFTEGNYCKEQFLNFLRHLDQTHETIQLKDGTIINSMTNLELFKLFEFIDEQILRGDPFNDNVQIKLQANHEINNIFTGQDPQTIKDTMLTYFKNLYEKRLSKTKAFDHLYQFYDSNSTIKNNLSLLSLQLKEVEDDI